MDNNGFVKDTPWQTNGDSGLHEECGVFGMYDFDGGDVASTIYYGLFALQHRGQESCCLLYTSKLSHLQILGGIKNGSKSSNQWFWPYWSSCFQTCLLYTSA